MLVERIIRTLLLSSVLLSLSRFIGGCCVARGGADDDDVVVVIVFVFATVLARHSGFLELLFAPVAGKRLSTLVHLPLQELLLLEIPVR